MRNFTTTYSMNRMYGPGDEETWGPVTHPMDPRQPLEADEIVREEARLEIIDQRVMKDIGVLTKAIEESDDATLRKLWKGYYLEDTKALIEAVGEIIQHCAPDDEQITDHIRGQK